MRVNKILFSLLVPAFILITSTFILFNSIRVSAPSNTQGIKDEGSVCIYYNDWDEQSQNYSGNELIECKHNIVYNDGLEAIQSTMTDGINFSFIEIVLCNATVDGSGNGTCGTPIAGQTEGFSNFWATGPASPACGMGNRTASTIGDNGASSGNWSVSATFTNTCTFPIQTNATRLKSHTGFRNLSGLTFTRVNLSENDQITVNWTHFVSSG